MNFYQFHIGDYIKQTVHLTPMEDICYRRLIDMYYETEQPIPTETDRVSRRLRLDTELVDSVLKEFFTLTENGWENARCNKEIDVYHVKADTARSNGMLGGRPKKTQSVSDRNPTESGSKANQEPRTNNQEPVITPLPPKGVKFNPLDIPIPACIKAEKWCEWIAYRRSRKLSISEMTARKQLALLEECAGKGHDPGDIIDASITNGWQGLFEPKATGQRGGKFDPVAYVNQGRKDARHEYTGNTIDGKAERLA